MRFIASPIMIIIGFLLMKYPVQTARITGPLDFAEKYFRSMGGTFAWWRTCGFFLVMLGLLWLTGVLQYSDNAKFQLPGTGEQAGQ